MSNHEKTRARSKHRDWIFPALGGSAAGVLFGLTVVVLMDPVVDATLGQLTLAGVSLGVAAPEGLRLKVLGRARRVATWWKALAVGVSMPGFVACADPVAVSDEGAFPRMTEPRLSDTVHPCRVSGGDSREPNDRLELLVVGHC